jgi:hypothetical protein
MSTGIFFAKTGSNQSHSLMPTTVKCWLWPLVPVSLSTHSTGIRWLVPSISDHSLQTPTNGTVRLRQLLPADSDHWHWYLLALTTDTCRLRPLIPADFDNGYLPTPTTDTCWLRQRIPADSDHWYLLSPTTDTSWLRQLVNTCWLRQLVRTCWLRQRVPADSDN